MQDFPEEFTDEQTHALFDFLIELFMLQQFDHFEYIIQRTEHSELLNLMANFLFNKHEIDKAVTYYQTLLEKDQLTAKSCMNLAYLHYNNKLYEDSVAFFESALEMNPKLKQLYVPLIKSIQDDEKKELYRKKLFFQYPHYIKLPIIQHL
jgi:tetratricopeptide (TPR) repeat protein